MPEKPQVLSPGAETYLEELAQGVLASHPPGERVDPEAIATAHGLCFRYESFPEEFDGILLCDNGRFLLVCNERRAPRVSARGRFTFAHELGHYLIPSHRDALVSGAVPAHFSLAEFASHYPVEREADCFAAHLLMPAAGFRARALESEAKGLALIRELSDHFGTSLTSTAYRGLALNLFSGPAAIFRWDNLGQLVSRRMSPATALRGWDYYALADLPAPETLTARATANLRVGHESAPTHIADWFPKINAYTPDHQIPMREEVMSLGSHGWLTLVHR